jgi:hypothetical protein
MLPPASACAAARAGATTRGRAQPQSWLASCSWNVRSTQHLLCEMKRRARLIAACPSSASRQAARSLLFAPCKDAGTLVRTANACGPWHSPQQSSQLPRLWRCGWWAAHPTHLQLTQGCCLALPRCLLLLQLRSQLASVPFCICQAATQLLHLCLRRRHLPRRCFPAHTCSKGSKQACIQFVSRSAAECTGACQAWILYAPAAM